MKHSRRKFIHKSLQIGAAGIMTTPKSMYNSVRSFAPSDQINVGLIGCRNRGFHVLLAHLKTGMVNATAICDIDQSVLDEKSAILSNEFHQKPKQFRDFRLMLEMDEIDAVIIGTPDHWHCLQAVNACMAGKDVYVEKPLANSVEECKTIEKATQRYQRVIQVGQQQRSGRLWNDVMHYLKSGNLGKIYSSRIWANFNYGLGPKKQPNAEVPSGVDYDMFLGPAQKKPFNPSRFHGSWRHFWDYGGGLMTDWGVHLIDMALWAKDIASPPSLILAHGRQFNRPELAKETYDQMSVIYTHGDYTIEWESMAGKEVGPYGRHYGIAFLCENGTLVADRDSWEVIPEWDSDDSRFKTNELNSKHYRGGTDLHAQNFLDCIKTRNQPACPAELGSNVAQHAHFANIAVRSGEYKLEWDPSISQFGNSPAANAYLKPTYRDPWIYPDV